MVQGYCVKCRAKREIKGAVAVKLKTGEPARNWKGPGFETSIIPIGAAKYVFFGSRSRHTRFDCDWSSDVCSSDLAELFGQVGEAGRLDVRIRVRKAIRPAARSLLEGALDERGAQARGLGRAQVAFVGRHHQHARSEERRVGKECRSRWSPYH